MDLVHAIRSALSERDAVLSHNVTDRSLHVRHAHRGIEECLSRLDGAIPVVGVVPCQNVLHSLLVKQELLIPELESLTLPTP